MYWIDAILDEIEPVVIAESCGLDVTLTTVIYERRIPRYRRRVIHVWPHVRENQSAKLAHGIGHVPDLLMILAVFGFPRLLQALARDVKEPPMVRAADTARFDVAVFERAPSVGTMQAH